MKYPIKYQVRFKLSVYNNENKVKHESFFREYNDENPLLARKKAFDDYIDFFNLLEKENRITKDQSGNFLISQPKSITSILEKSSGKIHEWLDQFEFYKEEISVYFILTDEEYAKQIFERPIIGDMVETEFLIHQIASYPIEKQTLADNLEMAELKSYNHFNLDVSELKQTIYHYGLDYSESGEEEDGAKRDIMWTPMVWDSFENYTFFYKHQNFYEPEPEPDTSGIINYQKVIEKGESSQIEFKPSLNYHYSNWSWRGKLEVNFEIAKTICSFLNKSGGTLFVGMDNNGKLSGLKKDYSLLNGDNKKDLLLLSLNELIVSWFGKSKSPLINGIIEILDDKDLLIIEVQESPRPVFMMNQISGTKDFFARIGPSSQHIKEPEEIIDYVFNKKWNGSNN